VQEEAAQRLAARGNPPADFKASIPVEAPKKPLPVTMPPEDEIAIARARAGLQSPGGLPDTEAFPREIYDDIAADLGRDYLASALQYGPTDGMLELREHVVNIMAEEGARARVEDIMITSGGQQAIDLSIRTFVDRGDTVLAEGPTYPGAVPCFTAYGADVTHIPLDDDGMRIDLMEEAHACNRSSRRDASIFTILLNQCCSSVRCLRTLLEPCLNLGNLKAQLGFFTACDWIVNADELQSGTTLAFTAVSHDNVVEGLLLRAASRQAYRHHRLTS
jgi:hypothetical protein